MVIAIIAILASLLLPSLSRAKERGKRAVCMSNLKQCGYALNMYAEEYGRYPHQREPTSGNPFTDDSQPVWTLFGYYVAREWTNVLRAGIDSHYGVRLDNTADLRLRVLSCPDLGDPIPNLDHSGAPNGGDGWVFQMNYYYVGGAVKWSRADPAYSPIKPEDSPSWTLMVDKINEHPGRPGYFWNLAHKEQEGRPAGANHLFNDQHVEWVPWRGGSTMRANSYWAPGENYYWRRTMETP